MSDDKSPQDCVDGTAKSPALSDSSSGQVKRKKHQISIVDYFKKRRTSATEEDASGGKMVTSHDTQRELIATAADRRLEQSNAACGMPVYDAESCGGGSTDEALDESFDVAVSMDTLSCNHEPTPVEESPPAFYRAPASFTTIADHRQHLQSLSPQPDHVILFRPHLPADAPPYPYPTQFRNVWDKDNVRMPCSKDNLYPSPEKKILNRWDLINNVLLKMFWTSKDLQDAILSYNFHYRDKWNFEGWHVYCNQVLCDSDREDLFRNLLPAIAKLALQLPTICTQSMPLMKRKHQMKLSLSQQQIACLLANAFFCTFPRRNSQKYSEYSCFPDINFNRLFRGVKDVLNAVKVEKIRCILNYFRRVTKQNTMPTGTVTFERKVLNQSDVPDWSSCQNCFCDLAASSCGTIEEQGEGLLQVDFANRLVGGGVIGMGCVQEEIRFLICPEMIISRLFTERLDANECLLMTGCERFNSYTGYAQTFKWTGDYLDVTPRDKWGRRHSEVVAMDALVFHRYEDQFREGRLLRELSKAVCGFSGSHCQSGSLPAVATGNWGCGAFGGDPRIKALIQLMAAAVCKRDVLYLTFGDEELAQELIAFHRFLRDNEISIRRVWYSLRRYEVAIGSNDEYIRLLPYLIRQLRESEQDVNETDTEGALDASSP